MKTSVAVRLFLALLMAMHGVNAQDTAVYRPSVAEPRRPAMEIYLVAPIDGVPVGAKYEFHAQVFDSVNNQFRPTLHWRSSDTTVASVRTTGALVALFIGKRKGRTVVTAYTDSLIKSIVVFVGRMPQAARIDIVPRRATIGVGETIRFLPVVRDELGRLLPPGFLLWSWSDTAAVQFLGGTGEQELILRGVRDGEIAVFADRDGRSAQATLAVGAGGRSSRVHSIVLSPGDTTVRVGDDIDFTASPLGDGDTTLAGRLVRWSVCDTTLIRRWTFEPRQSNHITYRALRAGTCRVSVTAGDVRRSSRVVIRP